MPGRSGGGRSRGFARRILPQGSQPKSLCRNERFQAIRRRSTGRTLFRDPELGRARELFWASGEASIEEIEAENIVGATCLAMKRAMDAASEKSQGLWSPEPKSEDDLFSNTGLSTDEKRWVARVDGRRMKKLPYEHTGLVKGDTISLAVAMGSLIAKVTRDRMMREFAEEFPDYDFASNKGYGAPNHLKALKESGPTRLHRPRFLRNLLPETEEAKQDDSQSQLSFG